ncbi:SDR family NAD(P)-dependent oxidoreductase, partial [Flavobacterium sp. LBUM151]
MEKEKPKKFPEQKQNLPGNEHKMNPLPEIIRENYTGSGKLLGKVAFITGGDSGIGRSVAVHFAREGADIAIVYFKEDKDALETKALIEKEGQQCLIISGDLKDEKFCKSAVKKCHTQFKKINIVVNNAAVQFPQTELEQITSTQLHKTFETNIYPYFYITQAALPFLKEGDTIINTSSVTAYRGSEHLSLLNSKLYQYEKKENLKEFRKALNIKEEEKFPEKEWSIKMILTRLFIYPFCFALILLNLFLIIPEGSFFIAIPTLC